MVFLIFQITWMVVGSVLLAWYFAVLRCVLALAGSQFAPGTRDRNAMPSTCPRGPSCSVRARTTASIRPLSDARARLTVQNILGYLGILQIIGTIFEASGVEVDNIEYNQLANVGQV